MKRTSIILRSMPMLSMRSWLVGLCLLALAPLLVLSGSIMLDYRNYRQAALLSEMSRLTADLAQNISEDLMVARSAVIALAQSDAARHARIHDLYDEALRVQTGVPEIRAFTLVSRTEVKFITREHLDRTQLAPHLPELIDEALTQGGANISGVFKSPINQTMVVAITAPIRAAGQPPQLALRAVVRSDMLQKRMLAQNVPAQWITTIVDGHGHIVARNVDNDEFAGRDASPTYFEGLKKPRGQLFEGRTVDGIESVGLIQPIPGSDWTMAVGVPRKEFEGPLTGLMWRLSIIATLWIGAAILISILLSNYLVGQIRHLAHVVADPNSRPNGTLRVRELEEMFDHVSSLKMREAQARTGWADAETQRMGYQDLYDQAPCGYHSLDREGRILRINQTELGWLGRTSDEMVGQPLTRFMTPQSTLQFTSRFPEFLELGSIQDLEFDLVRKDGSIMPVLVSATGIRDAAGRIVASRSTLFDNRAKRDYEHRLLEIARTDPLTLLPNRRALDIAGLTDLSRCRRHNLPLSMLMIDVDRFKTVNDSYGHDAGDAVLRALATCIRDHVRQMDTPARYGGEEFCVLMPEANVDEAKEVAERLRRSVQALRFPSSHGDEFAVTISVGVAQWESSEPNLEGVFRRADQALYQAKTLGRNQVAALA